MKLSVQYPEHASPEFAVEFVKHADRLGYDTVWVTESYGYDCVSTLGYWPRHRADQARDRDREHLQPIAGTPRPVGRYDRRAQRRPFVLGLGTSGRAVVEVGMGRISSVAHASTGVDRGHRMAIRRERVVYDGEVLKLAQGSS